MGPFLTKKKSITLADGEYISSIEGSYATSIVYLKFQTNMNQTLEGGLTGGTPIEPITGM